MNLRKYFVILLWKLELITKYELKLIKKIKYDLKKYTYSKYLSISRQVVKRLGNIDSFSKTLSFDFPLET